MQSQCGMCYFFLSLINSFYFVYPVLDPEFHLWILIMRVSIYENRKKIGLNEIAQCKAITTDLEEGGKAISRYPSKHASISGLLVFQSLPATE